MVRSELETDPYCFQLKMTAQKEEAEGEKRGKGSRGGGQKRSRSKTPHSLFKMPSSLRLPVKEQKGLILHVLGIHSRMVSYGGEC